jgi:diamine N-acetyltransferase
VHDGGTGALVGFAMISDNIAEPIDEDLVGPYFLWKLLIDESCQGRGYGTATVNAVVRYLERRPGADVLFTSCSDGPGSPDPFYRRYGFTDTGRIMWGENVLTLDLRRSDPSAPSSGALPGGVIRAVCFGRPSIIGCTPPDTELTRLTSVFH